MALPNWANVIVDAAIPNPQSERFVFRRFDGAALARASAVNGSISANDVTTVALQINPQELSHDNSKVTNKVATNAPGRFIIFDWGNDLTVLNIRGVTGNLLPPALLNRFDPAKSVIDGVIRKLDPDSKFASGMTEYQNTMGYVAAYGQRILQGALSYYEILEMSPKYRTFRRLRDEIYIPFDADTDVLTLEIGETIYRCYFTNFRFSIVKDSPWNWSYEIGVVALSDLTSRGFYVNDEFYGLGDTIAEE